MTDYDTDDDGKLWFCDRCFWLGEPVTHGSYEAVKAHLEDQHGIVNYHETFMTHDSGYHTCDHEWSAWDEGENGKRECQKCNAVQTAQTGIW